MRADSPMYLSTMADATTLRYEAEMLLASARASSVLPVPGGPYSNTPCVQQASGSEIGDRCEQFDVEGKGSQHNIADVSQCLKGTQATNLWRLDADAHEQLRIGQRQLNDLAQLANLIVQPANVLFNAKNDDDENTEQRMRERVYLVCDFAGVLVEHVEHHRVNLQNHESRNIPQCLRQL